MPAYGPNDCAVDPQNASWVIDGMSEALSDTMYNNYWPQVCGVGGEATDSSGVVNKRAELLDDDTTSSLMRYSLAVAGSNKLAL